MNSGGDLVDIVCSRCTDTERTIFTSKNDASRITENGIE